MNIQNNNYNSTNFGMALNMPSQSKLVRKYGTRIAGKIEEVRPEMKALAKDFDISVKTKKFFYNVPFTTLTINVSKVEKNPIKRFLSKIGLTKSPKMTADVGHIRQDNIGQYLVHSTKRVIEDLNKLA